MDQALKIRVSYRWYERLVTVEDDSYELLLKAFEETFADVIPSHPAAFRFQGHVPEINDYVDIGKDESTAEVQKIRVHEIYVTYREYKRWVTVATDTYEEFVEEFKKTFKPVLSASNTNSTESLQFRRYASPFDEYLVLKEGDSLAGTQAVRVKDLRRVSSTSYSLENDTKFRLWFLGSHTENGYLQCKDPINNIITADGKGTEVESEWIAFDVPGATTYWKFQYGPDTTKYLGIDSQDNVILKVPSGPKDKSVQFHPGYNGRYLSLVPHKYSTANMKFLVSAGDGSLKLTENKNPGSPGYSNPTPQALIVPYMFT